MALYIPHSIFHLARLLYVRPETFGPYYVCLHYCEHLILGPVFEPKRVRIGSNLPVWLLHAAYEALAYETKCLFGISGHKIRLGNAGFLRQPARRHLVHEYICNCLASKTCRSSHEVDQGITIIKWLEVVFAIPELKRQEGSQFKLQNGHKLGP